MTVLVEPKVGLFAARGKTVEKVPKFTPVTHVNPVCGFVGCHIVEYEGRRHDEPPRKR
jgi:hypothetical protein